MVFDKVREDYRTDFVAAASSTAGKPEPSIFFQPSFAPRRTNQPFTPGNPLWTMRMRGPVAL